MNLVRALALASLALTAEMGGMPKLVGFHRTLYGARRLLIELKEALKELEDTMLSAEQKKACLVIFGEELGSKIIAGAEGKPFTGDTTTKDVKTFASGAENFFNNQAMNGRMKNGSLPDMLAVYKPTLGMNSHFKYKK